MQRKLLNFVFALMLVFAQHQALVHPLTHLTLAPGLPQATAPSASADHGNHHEENCGRCISLAGIGTAVDSEPPVFALISTTKTPPQTSTTNFHSVFVPDYHSRAPPSIPIV